MTSGFAQPHLQLAWSSEEMGEGRGKRGGKRETERNSGLALVPLNSNCWAVLLRSEY